MGERPSHRHETSDISGVMDGEFDRSSRYLEQNVGRITQTHSLSILSSFSAWGEGFLFLFSPLKTLSCRSRHPALHLDHHGKRHLITENFRLPVQRGLLSPRQYGAANAAVLIRLLETNERVVWRRFRHHACAVQCATLFT
jgi:hypothetical protein